MRTIMIGGLGNTCTVSGRGQAAVLLHGSAGSKTQWGRLTRMLEDRFQVFAPDLLGHGGTAPWQGLSPMTLADEAMVIAALVRHVSGPVHLVGHSYGGAVALHFAQSYPTLVSSLVLIEPVAFHLLRTTGSAYGALLARIEQLATTLAEAEDDEAKSRAMARFVDFWNGEGAWAEMSAERRAAVETKIRAIATHFAATLGDPTPPASYGRVAAPTLVMYGTETPAPTRCIAESLLQLLPVVQTLRVAGAGHMLPITHAEIVNSAVEAHLREAGVARRRSHPGH